MTDNPTLTPAALRMLTALGGATFANDLAKTYDDTLKNHPNNKWALSEIARYNAGAEAAQKPPALSRFSDPGIKDHMIPAARRMMAAVGGYGPDE
jgi:hypothetical protein